MSKKLTLDDDNGGDSAELAEYKKKVLKVAADHSAQYHCGGLGTIRRDLDLREPTTTAKVVVTTSHPFELTVSVHRETFNNLADADAQKEHLSALINDRFKLLGNEVSVTIPASSITEVKKAPDDEPPKTDDDNPYPGYKIIYKSPRSEVQHLTYDTAGPMSFALCGDMPNHMWSEISTHPRTTFCVQCRNVHSSISRRL